MAGRCGLHRRIPARGRQLPRQLRRLGRTRGGGGLGRGRRGRTRAAPPDPRRRPPGGDRRDAVTAAGVRRPWRCGRRLRRPRCSVDDVPRRRAVRSRAAGRHARGSRCTVRSQHRAPAAAGAARTDGAGHGAHRHGGGGRPATCGGWSPRDVGPGDRPDRGVIRPLGGRASRTTTAGAPPLRRGALERDGRGGEVGGARPGPGTGTLRRRGPDTHLRRRARAPR